jgi:AcrR family transcriptional regulator
MHHVAGRRKGGTSDRRIQRSERAIMAAARELFTEQGYAHTTIGQVAERADCAERTVFLRFGSKADLFRRVVGETFTGADDPAVLLRAATAPTLDERIGAFADRATHILTRTGPLFRVAREAEAIDPDIAQAFNAARADTLATSRRMWQSLADDGLLHPDVDVDWVAETTGLLAAADTYLLIQATVRWTPDQLRNWLYRTWIHLATTPSPSLPNA